MRNIDYKEPLDRTKKCVTVIAAEGARVGFVVCANCGAAILIDPRDGSDPIERHRELDAVICWMSETPCTKHANYVGLAS
jgi:hypothetical protein